MTDAYQPSPLGGAPAAVVVPTPMTVPPPAPASTGAYSPSDIYGALVARNIPPDHARILTAATGAESGFGKSQVGSLNSNGSRDYGLGQINNKAWPQLNPPSLVGAPLDRQADAIAYVYHHQNLPAWATINSGAYKKYLPQVDSTTPIKGTQVGAAHTVPGAPAAAPAQQPQQFNMGAALAALNAGQGSSGGSSSGGGGGGEESAPPAPDRSGEVAAASGNARSAMLMGQAAQLAEAIRQKGAQGLTWGSQPFGAGTAGPQIPGTTLNSMGA